MIASAAGAALATGTPTWVLIGEVALVHDAGGLLAAGRAGADIHVVCVNNAGGGIFDFLPLAGHADPACTRARGHADRRRPAALAAAAGRRAGSPEVRTDRADSVRLHRELYERVGAPSQHRGSVRGTPDAPMPGRRQVGGMKATTSLPLLAALGLLAVAPPALAAPAKLARRAVSSPRAPPR